MSNADSDSNGSAQSARSRNNDAGGVTTRRVRKMCVSTPTKRESSDNIRKFNLKVPDFSPDDPEIWFAVLESQFENIGITEDNIKFNNVIANLGTLHAKTVKDIILKPPSLNRYDRIKAELIKRLTASHEDRVRQLLTHEVLGDRKPTQFLRHLQDLAGPSVPEEFLRTIWSNRLPHGIQTILASQTSLHLEQLAELADRIQEISTPANVATTSAPGSRPEPGPSSTTSSEIAELRKMVERLSTKLDEHSRQPRRTERFRHRRDRSSDRSSSRGATRSHSSYRKYPICWYHGKFGSRAFKCEEPCDYKKSGNAAGNHQ